jgi:hypothetical protein
MPHAQRKGSAWNEKLIAGQTAHISGQAAYIRVTAFYAKGLSCGLGRLVCTENLDAYRWGQYRRKINTTGV